jgi:hypothetical protein
MAQMVRKQVYIEKRHAQMLKRRAKQRGVSEAEIVREALDKMDGDAEKGSTTPDEGAREAIAFMRSLAERKEALPGGRDWTRDDLYEERIGRWIKS